LFNGADIEVHSLDLSINADITLLNMYYLGGIDMNKYGDVIIYGFDKHGDNQLFLGRYNDPGSFKNIYTDGVVYARWLSNGEYFTHSTNYSASPHLVIRNREGVKIWEKNHSDSVYAVLDEIAPGVLLTTSSSLNDKIYIATCDSSMKNYKVVYVVNSNSKPLDYKYVSDTKKLLVITSTESTLLEVNIEAQTFSYPSLNCENIITDGVDYCPANHKYLLCARQPIWENGTLTFFKQYLCKSSLTDRKVEVFKTIPQ
jgi:hypothetical protein